MKSHVEFQLAYSDLILAHSKVKAKVMHISTANTSKIVTLSIGIFTLNIGLFKMSMKRSKRVFCQLKISLKW